MPKTVHDVAAETAKQLGYLAEMLTFDQFDLLARPLLVRARKLKLAMLEGGDRRQQYQATMDAARRRADRVVNPREALPHRQKPMEGKLSWHRYIDLDYDGEEAGPLTPEQDEEFNRQVQRVLEGLKVELDDGTVITILGTRVR